MKRVFLQIYDDASPGCAQSDHITEPTEQYAELNQLNTKIRANYEQGNKFEASKSNLFFGFALQK